MYRSKEAASIARKERHKGSLEPVDQQDVLLVELNTNYTPKLLDLLDERTKAEIAERLRVSWSSTAMHVRHYALVHAPCMSLPALSSCPPSHKQGSVGSIHSGIR
jgi:hypothetical protein